MEMRSLFVAHLVLVSAAVLAEGFTFAQRSTGSTKRSATKPRRARPPKFDAQVTSTFFDDASKVLNGPRPKFSTGNGPKQPGPGPVDPKTPDSGGKGVYAWSKLISAETVEDEIKRINLLVGQNVTTPTKFRGGGFKKGRVHFSMLAVLFAITAEYDGEIRFKKIAPGARQAFARAGFNCKVGTIGAYNEAKARKLDIADLVRGSSVTFAKGDVKATWVKVADRPPLMKWLEEAQQNRLSPWTASDAQFKKNNEKLLHEAQIVAALADVISRESYEFGDDPDYVKFCTQLKKAALDVVEAVKGDNAADARKAVGVMGQSCSDCHEDYRG